MIQDPTEAWEARRQEWLRYTQKTLETLRWGRRMAVGPSSPPLVAPLLPGAPGKRATVLIASPHPDDEALTGALPLRLRLESGARVINCAVTFGRDLSQRSRRRGELESSCRALGFELTVPGEWGFSDVRVESRSANPKEWQEKVEALREILDRERPDAVLAPHAEDFNSTHIGTHYLVADALRAHAKESGRAPGLLVETEYWHEHSRPNLMIGVSPEVLAIQLMATAEHGGEVRRNPYHLGLPARMVDNVRRGSEVVGGQGAAAQPFPFAELYRVTFMGGNQQVEPRAGGLIVSPDDRINLDEIYAKFWPANP